MIAEIDLTNADYAELMAFASQFDDEALSQMKLDLRAQSYKDYPMRFCSPASHCELESALLFQQAAE